MTARRFAANILFANTDTVLYGTPLDVAATVNVRFVNQNMTVDPTGDLANNNIAFISLALVDANIDDALTDLSPDDYLEFEVPLEPGYPLEDLGIIIPPNHTLVGRSSLSDVSFTVYGFSQQQPPETPVIRIDNITVQESDSLATFTLTRTGSLLITSTVDYEVIPGTGLPPSTVQTGTVTFAPNSSTETIDVPLVDDLIIESVQFFTVQLSNPVDAVLDPAENTGTATVIDDD